MLPKNNYFDKETENIILSDKQTLMPCLNHRMNFKQKRIFGKTDDIYSVMQSVYKILNTERYRYIIYSDDYGVEFEELFGRPISYAKAELPHRIMEALLYDDRIISVEDFKFKSEKRHCLSCEFTVNSIFGEFKIKKEVNI